MKYIGPISKKGVMIRGRLWAKPWEWKPEEITKNIAAEPKLDALFTEEKKQSSKGS